MWNQKISKRERYQKLKKTKTFQANSTMAVFKDAVIAKLPSKRQYYGLLFNIFVCQQCRFRFFSPHHLLF